jgi:hypothetical protein
MAADRERSRLQSWWELKLKHRQSLNADEEKYPSESETSHTANP